MSFEEYLIQKKIDPIKFQRQEPTEFLEWQRLFLQMHPASFTSQKKFLINIKRRMYIIY